MCAECAALVVATASELVTQREQLRLAFLKYFLRVTQVLVRASAG